MNFRELKAAAQAYCDRYDEEMVDVLPSFMRVVESKINTALKTGEQSVRSRIYLDPDQEYYGLPSDWAGFREVEILSPGDRTGSTLTYLPPEEMSKLNRRYEEVVRRHNYYTVVANQIQIAPPSQDDVLEVVYFQRVPALTSDDQTTWLSEKAPDAYIFGLCCEISGFAKDEVSFAGYDARFKEALMQITQDDQVTRWSGPSLHTQVEGLVV